MRSLNTFSWTFPAHLLRNTGVCVFILLKGDYHNLTTIYVLSDALNP